MTVFIFSLTSRLHFLNQICEEFLELIILLIDFNNWSFYTLDPLSVPTDLILNFKNFLKDNLSYLIETLHVSFLRFVLLECELALDLVIGRSHNLFHAFLEIVHPLSHSLIQRLHVLFYVLYLIHKGFGVSIEVFKSIFEKVVKGSFKSVILELGL
jgi:hypothetical protein